MKPEEYFHRRDAEKRSGKIVKRTLPVISAICGLLAGFCAGAAEAPDPPPTQKAELARQILADKELPRVLDMAKALLRTGLTAGSGYGEVWIRDLNTFIELSLEVNDPKQIREALINFFKFQGPEGDIVDGFIPRKQASVGYKFRESPLAPDLLAHKNTVETDQESSLILAVCRYAKVTGDRAILDVVVDGRSVRDRLGWAVDYLLKHRFDAPRGLIWGATTADWGDVQPESKWGVELDKDSHLSLDIYDNALLISALDAYVRLLGEGAPESGRWKRVRGELSGNVRKHLWDSSRGKFIPHVYLNGSPFPKEFNESEVWFHGGTAVAVEAGLLSRAEIAQTLEQMRENVRRAGASSIGLTVYPPYPQGFFQNKGMGPYSYQNGGDWCWFGGRMIRELLRNDFPAEAYRELKPMVSRVIRAGDFYEWWSLDNQPRGSKQYRGSAGVLGIAIQELLAWAEDKRKSELDAGKLAK